MIKLKHWINLLWRLMIPLLIRSKICLSVCSFFIGYFFHSSISFYNCNRKDNLKTEMSYFPQDSGHKDLLLVILIFSSVNNFSKRQTIRETWLSGTLSSNDIKHYFVISLGNTQIDQKILISLEEEKYKDLLILPNLDDSFFFLTKKLVASFGWLTDLKVLGYEGVSSTRKLFKNFKFMLKCDDDSYVRTNEIINELKHIYSGKMGENLYWGFFDGRAKVKKSGKYKEEEWNICDYYLPYALGGGYVLAQPLVTFIAKNENFLKKYKNEDVSVGAWLSSYTDINRVHDPRFDTEFLSRGCHQSYLITHKHSEKTMQNYYDNLQKTGLLCSKEFKTRMSYIYNWQVSPSNCCSRINRTIP